MRWQKPWPREARPDRPLALRRDPARIAEPNNLVDTRWNEETILAPNSHDVLQRLLHLIQHVQSLFEMGMEISSHQTQNLNDDGVSNGIEDLIAGLAIHNKLFRSQHRKMLRDISLLHAKFLD